MKTMTVMASVSLFSLSVCQREQEDNFQMTSFLHIITVLNVSSDLICFAHLC